MRITTPGFLILGFLATTSTASASVIYNDEATFLAALGASRTFDFETASGFPAADADIGLFDGIDFDAQTYEVGGGQAMTGTNSTFTPATIAFNTSTSGFGFLGFDLLDDEIIRVSVDYQNNLDEVFDITLGGAANFTPIYFGLIEAGDNILGITINGTDSEGIDRAWYIDDLSTNAAAAAVPEPATLLLSLFGFAGIAWTRKRHARK